MEITVPLSNGSRATIEHLLIHEAKKTLGVYACPTGCGKAQLEAMNEKAQEWIDNAKNGNIHRRHLWFSIERMFWLKVGYGICGIISPLKDLETCLHRQYYQLLPMGGLVRSAKVGIRTLNHGFFGAGLPHVGVEVTIQACNKLLMHYGCQSCLGILMKISMETFILEIGLYFQPFHLPYQRHHDLATTSYLKGIWEKASAFQFSITLNEQERLKFARTGDRWLMELFLDAGYTTNEMSRLN